MFRVSSLVVLMAAAAGCTRPALHAGSSSPTSPALGVDELEGILRSDAELAALLPEAERRRMQVSVAVPNGATALTRSGFRVDREYFYPASAVKLGVAFAALEKMGEYIDGSRGEVTPRSSIRYVTGEGRARRIHTTTVQRDIELALVVSDNDAFNRLLDFVGPEELAQRLSKRGLSSSRIIHHLGDASTWTLPTIELARADGSWEVVGQRIGFPIPPAPSVTLGRAYRDERGRLVNEPMSFASKNAVPLRELQDLLVGAMRPELMPTPSDWQIPLLSVLTDTLGLRPSDLDPRAGRDGGLDVRFKPLAVAVEAAFPDLDVHVYGKGGRAYGFAVENAYVVSQKTGRSFFVAATIYANDNDVMNDDRYEYDAIANPFMTRLAVVLAEHLLRPSSLNARVADRHDEHR